MGESILHVCLLCGSRIARNLAQRLLLIFPMLVVDIYLSNEYYGQTPLHMALVNEELVMAKLMLDLSETFIAWIFSHFSCYLPLFIT